MKIIKLLTGLAAVLVVVVMAGFAQANSGSIPLHNNTAGTEPDCPDTESAYWHFVFAPNSGYTFGTITLNIDGTTVDFAAPADLDNPDPTTEWIPNGTQTDNVFVMVPAGYTLDDLRITDSSAIWNDTTAPNKFNLSHVCTGTTTEEDEEHLTVTKTVDTSYDREHFWDISKEVVTENEYTHTDLPKIWLYADGSGNEKATWTVDVTYEGSEDSNWNVSGTVTVTNDGDIGATVNSVEDVLDVVGTISVDCEVVLPHDLAVGESFDCTYDEDVSEQIEGKNVATAKTAAGGEYSGEALIEWGDPNQPETNKVVTVQDISDLFGTVNLPGSVDAADCTVNTVCKSFTYDKEFAWADYGAAKCGDFVYDNEATIVETEQSADATLLVNVQCLLSASAWAKGTGAGLVNPARCFSADGFSNWGWTNNINVTGDYTWTLWAGAAKCDTSKGFDAGTVSFHYDTVTGLITNIVYSFNAGVTGSNTATYSGSAKYPKLGSKNTTAPGQYKLSKSTGNTWVIAHANVQYPDPNFGP